jgi:hypothetical protein
MTTEQFMALALEQRVEMVKGSGLYLTSILCGEEYDHIHIFYSLNGFFVELVQDFQGLGIREANAFNEDDEEMEDLLDEIDAWELGEFLEPRAPF